MMRRNISRCRLVSMVLALLLGCLALPAMPVGANTLHVTNCTDTGVSGDGSLRGEFAAAAADDTIQFDLDCTGASTISLTGGTLTLSANVTIDGSGHTVVLDGLCGFSNGACQFPGVIVFLVNSGVTATLNGLTIQHGSGSDCGPGILCGGAIFNDGGTVTVTNSIITNNSATYSGGGIQNNGTLTVTNSTITNNSATHIGGGIENSSGSTLTVTNSTLSGNSAPAGGAIYNFGGTVTVTNSTLSHNSASAGGGIYNYVSTATLTVTNSTLTGNSASAGAATGSGGGIYNLGTLRVTNSTLTGNSAPSSDGGGIRNAGTLMKLTNTIVATNTAPSGPDISGGVTTTDHNLLSSISGTTGISNGDAQGDIVNPTPRLGTLGSNDGPTQTIPLLAGSPAIGAGNATVCAASPVGGKDQRGYLRQASVCSIGAYEAQPVTPTPLPGGKPPGPMGGPPNPLPAVRPPGTTSGPAPNPLPVPRP